MNIAKEYLNRQMKNQEFQQGFLNEKARLNVEYQLEELKRNIAECKPASVLGQIRGQVLCFAFYKSKRQDLTPFLRSPPIYDGSNTTMGRIPQPGRLHKLGVTN